MRGRLPTAVCRVACQWWTRASSVCCCCARPLEAANLRTRTSSTGRWVRGGGERWVRGGGERWVRGEGERWVRGG